MATRFCPYCGRPVAPNANFCPSCGAALGGAGPTPGAPPGAPPGYFVPVSPPPTAYPPGYPLPPGTPVGSSEADRWALSSVGLAALLGLIGAVLSFVGELLVTPVVSIVSTSSGGSSVSVDLTALYLLAALGVVGFVFVLIEIWLYRRAFHALSPQDSRFSTPAKLALLAFITLLVAAVLLIALLGAIYQSVVCAGSGNPITGACINGGEILALAGVLGIVSILALVGYIGVLIGIWRLGTRYREGMFKVGAVLLIIPLLNIIGLILILIAARSARGKMGAYSPAPRFG